MTDERLLDIQRRYDVAFPNREGAIVVTDVLASAHDVPALLAEVKAMREVVDAAKEWRRADEAEVQDLTLEALEKLEAAVDRLESKGQRNG